MLEYVDPAQVLGESIYRADELELAKEAAIRMAAGRNSISEVEQIRSIDEWAGRIDVHRIDFSRMLTRDNRESELLSKMVVKVFLRC